MNRKYSYYLFALALVGAFFVSVWKIHDLANTENVIAQTQRSMAGFTPQGVTKVEDLDVGGTLNLATGSANTVLKLDASKNATPSKATDDGTTFSINETAIAEQSFVAHDAYATKDLETLTGTSITWTPLSTASYIVLTCDAGTTIKSITAPTRSVRMIFGIVNSANDCTFLDPVTSGGNITFPGAEGPNLVLQTGDPFVLTWIGDTQPVWDISTPRFSGVSAGTSISIDSPTVLGGVKTINVALPGGTCTTGEFVNQVDSDGTVHCAASGGGGGGSGGLFNQILSATPTQTSTGFTTWVNQPTNATVTNAADGLVLHADTSGSVNRSVLSAVAPAVPFSFTALVAMNQGPSIALGVSNGSTMEVFQISLSSGSPSICVTNATPPSTGGYGACTTFFPSGGQLEWVKLTIDAAHNATYYESSDGVAWRNIGGPFGGFTGYNSIVFAVDGSEGPADGTILSWTLGTN